MRRVASALAISALLFLGACTTFLGGGGSALEKEVAALRQEVETLKAQNRQGDLRGGSETAALRAELERLSLEVSGLSARLKRLD